MANSLGMTALSQTSGTTDLREATPYHSMPHLGGIHMLTPAFCKNDALSTWGGGGVSLKPLGHLPSPEASLLATTVCKDTGSFLNILIS